MKRWLYLVFILMTGCFAGHARQVVDVHSHNILPDYRAVLARHHAELEEGFPLPAWDVDSHLSFEYSADRDSVASADTAMLVRISEIEIYPQYRDAYLEAALEVGATSVREEPGVIAIFPMIQQRDSCQVRILEIYAGPEAYRHHIGTAHFQTYKQGTLHMVKRLDLVDMIPMNPAAMPEIFRKMKCEK